MTAEQPHDEEQPQNPELEQDPSMRPSRFMDSRIVQVGTRAAALAGFAILTLGPLSTLTRTSSTSPGPQ